VHAPSPPPQYMTKEMRGNVRNSLKSIVFFNSENHRHNILQKITNYFIKWAVRHSVLQVSLIFYVCLLETFYVMIRFKYILSCYYPWVH